MERALARVERALDELGRALVLPRPRAVVAQPQQRVELVRVRAEEPLQHVGVGGVHRRVDLELRQPVRRRLREREAAVGARLHPEPRPRQRRPLVARLHQQRLARRAAPAPAVAAPTKDGALGGGQRAQRRAPKDPPLLGRHVEVLGRERPRIRRRGGVGAVVVVLRRRGLRRRRPRQQRVVVVVVVVLRLVGAAPLAVGGRAAAVPRRRAAGRRRRCRRRRRRRSSSSSSSIPSSLSSPSSAAKLAAGRCCRNSGASSSSSSSSGPSDGAWAAALRWRDDIWDSQARRGDRGEESSSPVSS